MGEDANKGWKDSRFSFTVSAGGTEQKVVIIPWPKPEYAAPATDAQRPKKGSAGKSEKKRSGSKSGS